jgi:hypothetical protein
VSEDTKKSAPQGRKELRIFLSYSSAQLVVAQQVDMALTTNGHDVFFDRTDLPPGGEFHNAIHEAIRSSDLFVFLISPESVSKGSYARTELQYAQATWRNPVGRVLPVLAVETDFSAIPEYLKGCTFLRPDGNLAAEVTEAVNDLAAGISPNETFAEHSKLIKKTAEEAMRLRRQQAILEIEREWREESKRYGMSIGGIEIGDISAKAGALIIGLAAFAFALVMLLTFSGAGSGFITVMLLMLAAAPLSMYLRGRKYEKAKEDYLDRLSKASSDEGHYERPLFKDFMR